MLVTSANIGRDDLENHAVVALAVLFRQGQFRVPDVLDCDLPRLDINDTLIASHETPPIFEFVQG
jgi:hypothetical protein